MNKSLYTLALLASAAPAVPAFAQSAASPFTSASRFDAVGRVTGTIAPAAGAGGPAGHIAVRNTYNAKGELTRVEKGVLAAWQPDSVLPANWSGFTVHQVIDTTYDAMGRKLSDAMSAGGTLLGLTQYSYDALGRLDCTAVRMNLAATPPSSACTLGTQGSFGPDRITRNAYDAADQLTKVTEAYGTADAADEVTYGYTANGKKEYVTDANGNKAQLVHDGHDRQSEWRFPDKASVGTVSASDYEAYGYDADGNRTSFRNRAGETIAYGYDALNRMTLKDAPAGEQDVAYSYDLRGLQTSAAFAGGSVSLTNIYDNAGRLVSAATAEGGPAGIVAYQYDANGNRTRITHPGGFFVQYEHDGLDRVTTIKENDFVLLATYAYDVGGRRATLTRGNGTVATFAHDGADRLATLGEDMPGASHDQSLTFAYNPASQIASNTRSNDAYAWNGHANVSRAYAVNGLNQYTNVGGTVPTYDAKGNLTSAGTATYAYSSENRLTSGAGTTFGYDPSGRLYAIGSSARLIYDGADLIVEFSPAGSTLARYVHGPGTDDPIVWYDGPGTTGRRWLHADERGSIVAVSDGAGAVIGINRYDEYGVPAAGNLGRFQYTGQTWLPELGMYHYKARVYDPRLGRFLQVDPIGYDDQFNLYAYVGNQPINKTDPSGKCSSCQADEEAFDNSLQGKSSSEMRSAIMERAAAQGAALATVGSFLLPWEALAVKGVAVVARTLGLGKKASDAAKVGSVVERTALNPGQAANLKRYEKKLPSNAGETTITAGKDGSLVMSATSPGRVPGSSATYTKTMDSSGITTNYVKTTIGPNGVVVHVKVKF